MARSATAWGRFVVASVVAAIAAASTVATSEPAAATLPPPTAPAFVSRTVLASDSPTDVKSADFNGDGRPDLIAVGGSDDVARAFVWLGAGPAGSFGTRRSIQLKGTPTAILIGLVDDDDVPDALVSLGSAGTAILLGTGDGNFGPATFDPTLTGRLALGQLSGTGAPDLVATGPGNQVRFLEGDGHGAFTATGTTLTTYYAPKQVQLDDVDGDGHDDLLVTSAATPDISTRGFLTIHRSNGAGGFLAGVRYQADTTVSNARLGDLDEDGIRDLVLVSDTAGGGLYVLRGTGGGAFAAPVRLSLGTFPIDVAIRDLDGDGHLDLVAADLTQSAIHIAYGRGDGTFEPRRSLASGTPADLVVEDFDGDGDLDLATTEGSPGGVGIIDHLEARRFGTSSMVAAASRATAVGDVTGDGHADVVAAPTSGSFEIITLVNDGGGNLLPAAGGTDLTSAPTDLVLGRLDGDAIDDLVATTSTGVSVAKGLGDGTFGAVANLSVGATPVAPVLVDVDGDGDLDIVVDANGSAQVSVVRNDGTGGFGAATSYPVGSLPVDLAAGDLDGDGDADLVAVSDGDATLSVLEGAGDGTFASAASQPTLARPRSVAVGHFDGDDDLDVAVAAGITQATSRIQILLGDGDGTFTPGTLLSPGVDAGAQVRTVPSLAVSDLNSDDRDDLVLEGGRFYLGAGSGVFTAMDDPGQSGETSTSVVVGDVDGDGAPDLVSRSVSVRYGVAVAPSPWVPFASWGALVDQVYGDLLQRPPSAAERSADVAALGAGTLTKGGLVAQIRSGADHVGRVNPIVRLYRAYFLRNPDPSGLDYWAARRRDGRTIASISSQFARSAEFVRTYGPLTNAQFVDLVYRNVLGRTGDPSGVAFWNRQLAASKTTRGQLMANFSESSEFRTKQTSELDAAVLMTWLLRITPKGTPFDDAVATLDQGGTVADLATTILESPAYADRLAGS